MELRLLEIETSKLNPLLEVIDPQLLGSGQVVRRLQNGTRGVIPVNQLKSHRAFRNFFVQFRNGIDSDEAQRSNVYSKQTKPNDG
jgi:hypothetical protein